MYTYVVDAWKVSSWYMMHYCLNMLQIRSFVLFQGYKYVCHDWIPQIRVVCTCLYVHISPFMNACFLIYMHEGMNMLQITCICNFKLKNEFSMIQHPRKEVSLAYLFSKSCFMHACLIIYDAWMHEHALSQVYL